MPNSWPSSERFSVILVRIGSLSVTARLTRGRGTMRGDGGAGASAPPIAGVEASGRGRGEAGSFSGWGRPDGDDEGAWGGSAAVVERDGTDAEDEPPNRNSRARRSRPGPEPDPELELEPGSSPRPGCGARPTTA